MKKVDITKILRLFPKGAILYSPMLGHVELDSVCANGIKVKTCKSNEIFSFDKYGCWRTGGELMLFPRKSVNNWSGYNPDIEPGDVVIGEDVTRPFMFVRYSLEGKPIAACGINYHKDIVVTNACNAWTNDTFLKKATDSQKNYLVNNIGYIYKMAWNPLLNSLVKIVTNNTSDIEKFDVKTLQPFDKVVVRNVDSTWTPHFFSYCIDSTQVSCIGDNGWYTMCVPYNEETRNLIGTTDIAPEKYLWWSEK